MPRGEDRDEILTIKEFWALRHLTGFLVRREVEQRYRGSALGLFWMLLSSLLMLCIYTFVFNVIFVSRWPGMASDRLEVFAIVLFAGLSLYTFASECWSRATAVVADNATYVTKVVFPLELLPLVIVLASLVQLAINLSIVIVLSMVILGPPGIAIVGAVPVIISYVLLVLGVTYMIAFLGVFFRDMRMIVPFLLTALLYLSPVLYPVANTPESVRHLFALNPMSFYFESVRGSLFFDTWPSLLALSLALVFSGLVFAFGLYIYHRGTRAYADVL